MKKPKSKLDKAKERLINEWAPPTWADHSIGVEDDILYKKFRRQLNNLIRLAREEGRKGK